MTDQLQTEAERVHAARVVGANLVALYEDMRGSWQANSKPRDDEHVRKSFEWAERVLDGFAISARRLAVRPSGNEISACLRELCGAMEGAEYTPTSLSKFLKQATLDVIEEAPLTTFALLDGIRHVRRTCKSFPTIADLIEAISASEIAFECSRAAAQHLPDAIKGYRAKMGVVPAE